MKALVVVLILLVLLLAGCIDPIGDEPTTHVNYNTGTIKVTCPEGQYLDIDQAGINVCRIKQ